MSQFAAGYRLAPLSRGAAILALVLAARTLSAEMPGGRLMGLVEDGQGAPISGAVISLFGKGVGNSGLVTLTDSAGRFALPSLPPGPYTLRALRNGHTPAPARRVLILPNQDATFTISMMPLADGRGHFREAKATAESDAARDLQWLIRHKRRSALEDRATGPANAAADQRSRSDAASSPRSCPTWPGRSRS